jgi:hypothetical protein
MGKGIEGFLLCGIIPTNPCFTMAAVTVRIEVLLLALATNITIYCFGVVLGETGAMKVLVDRRLIALSL